MNRFGCAKSTQFNYFVDAGDVILSEEHDAWGYFAPHEVEIDEAMREVISDGLERLGK